MASEQWKRDDISYAMTPFKLLMWPIGVWPLQVYNVYSLMRCILATCCMSLVVILPSIELHMGCTDAEQNIDCLMLICCGVLAVLKMICFRIYASNLTSNYSSTLNDYLALENKEQRAIMRRHALVGRILCFVMVGGSYFDSSIYGIIPFVDNNLINVTNEDVIISYTMPSRCALSYLNVPANMYKISCVVEYITLIMACTSNYGNDTLFLNAVLHVCGQAKILNCKFANLDPASPQIHNHLNVLIQRHGHLLRMTRKLSEAISFILLMQLLVSSILLCIIGFQFILALTVNNSVMMTKSFMVLSVFLMQLSVYSFVGDYLKSQMEEIALSVYQNAWYDFPTKATRSLIFVIKQAQSPAKLLAGNFIAINLATYTSVLKTSVSYLSVLRVMVEI